MIRRLLARLGYALVTTADAAMVAQIRALDVCTITKVRLKAGDGFILMGRREKTDDEFLRQIGIATETKGGAR